MRPTNDELLVGVRHVLDDVLLPELQSPWAIAMGTQMLFILDHLTGRAEREPRFLVGENQRLAGLLGKAEAWLADKEPSLSDNAIQDDETDLDVLRVRNGELRAAISRAIEQAYERGDYSADELPTVRMGIDAGLIEVLGNQAEFWKPIAIATLAPKVVANGSHGGVGSRS